MGRRGGECVDRCLTLANQSPLNTTIRKATADDAAAAWDIRNAAILHAYKGFYAEELLATWTEGNPTDRFVQCVVEQFYVATADDRIVGTGAIDVARGKLDAVFVHPHVMGRGIGKQIVLFLESVGRAAGLTRLTLDSTLNAAPFYRRLGFVGEAVGAYESPRGIVLDCIPMTKLLSSTTGDG